MNYLSVFCYSLSLTRHPPIIKYVELFQLLAQEIIQ